MSEDQPLTGLVALALVVVVTGAAVAAPVGVGGTAAAAGNTSGSGPVSVESCTTIDSPGVYELEGDVTSSSPSCINVTASDVVLDGRGHTLEGPGENREASVGVNVTAPSNVTVRDINVTAWAISRTGRPIPVST